ncbi:uncharacterized protein [Venturia canescens]|uniref:uncharacterized protein isoform X2 n=1 Tax=Venturia canescens TaxID=32260 RepID=UPI001C9C90DA|nr:uncharacterized protein LOC122412366 isoform X2 [Venturia canescens]
MQSLNNMCSNKKRNPAKNECFLVLFATVFLSCGLCQNIEPKIEPGSFKAEEIIEKKAELQDGIRGGENLEQRFDYNRWDGSRDIGKSLNDDVNLAVPSLTESGNLKAKTEAPVIRDIVLDDKHEASSEFENRPDESTTQASRTTVRTRCKTKNRRRGLCTSGERSYKNLRRRYPNFGRGFTVDDWHVPLSNRIRGGPVRSRRFRWREQGKPRSRKNNTAEANISPEAPAALREATSEQKQGLKKQTTKGLITAESLSNKTIERVEETTKNGSSEKILGSVRSIDADNTILPDVTSKPDGMKERREENEDNGYTRSLENPEMLRRRHEENVEHEFSRNLEKEILWSRTEFPDASEESPEAVGGKTNSFSTIKPPGAKPTFVDSFEAIKNSRYDAAKMLGYSRSAEDMPIVDLENEVLARTFEDYKAYLKSGGKTNKFLRHSSDGDVNAGDNARDETSRPIARPLYRHEVTEENGDQRKLQQQREHHELELSEELGDTEPGATLKGDLTCINGTFIPAPLARHALIKYVKSSIPGHEYLEADYECTPGFYMASSNSRLLCKNRRWIGALPNCKIRRGQSGPCADSSCDHVCNEVDGQAKCSCYKGFRLDGHKCYDINECESQNGGCEYNCVNTPGSYRCECPQGMKRGENKFTCIDVDECYVPDLQTEICHYGCINTPGSYRCVDPTELSDQPIQDSISITCFPGYELTTGSNCIDINECAINNGGCSEVCENTEGSYFCACDGDEKALSTDGKSCTDINNLACPPLDPARRGFLMCSRETTPRMWSDVRRETNRPGTKCYLKCPVGYQLHGEYELTCQGDGTWDGPKHGECVKYSKPTLECPKDVVAEVPPDRDEAFVTFDQPSTDLDWFRYVRSKPSWGTRLEASLKPGLHLVTFFARHPVSKKQASCVLRIIVKEGEAPKVNNCPSDIVGRNGTFFTWTEPTFTDNVRVTHTSNNESPGKSFGTGEWKIVYEASDEAGWTTRCVFSVVVHQN